MSRHHPGARGASARRRTPARLAAAVAVLTLGLLATACSGLDGTEGKGYVSGGGTIRELDPGDRGKAVSFEGEAVTGDDISLGDQRGKVVVLNVWGNWCGECHVEAEDVVGAAERTQGDDVIFVGINVRDPSKETAAGYERKYDVPYQSFYDPAGTLLLEFHGTLNAYATPSTVVLDREGRVAASVIGVIPSEQTLVSIIEKVVEDG